MRQTPTKEELLGAVAEFLDEAVRPALDHRGLAFRVRIATNLLRTVSVECWRYRLSCRTAPVVRRVGAAR